MEFIKRFEKFEEENDTIIDRIASEYTKEKVDVMLKKEITEWVDSDIKGDDEKIEWYKSHGNGEAEDVIISSIIEWYEKKFDKIDKDDKKELYTKLIKLYKLS